MSTLKKDRHESKKFMVYEQAKELRNEVTRYIIHDFNASGALAFMGPEWLSDRPSVPFLAEQLLSHRHRKSRRKNQ